MKFIFTETKEIDFNIDFQDIYNYVKAELEEDDPDYHPTKYDIHVDFSDNMDYYIKKIYNYEIEDNENNEMTIDYIFQEWGKWIDNYNED